MKKYEAPMLFVDEFVADTMIASAGSKNDNAGNNPNCWGCNQKAAATDSNNSENSCGYTPGDGLYEIFC